MLKARSLVMTVRVSHLLSGLSVAAILAFTPLAASAQNAPMMGGGMKGEEMMGGGMKGEEMMKGGGMMGCDMMGGGMMGGDMDHMSQMMTMMREKLSHAGDRIASLKTELKITEAQTPAWNKFADALLASAKSMGEAMDAMHTKMQQAGAAVSLPEKFEHRVKVGTAHIANLQAIKDTLDPLYASFSDEQKKLADALKIGPMGLM
jgi:hypothetical protein